MLLLFFVQTVVKIIEDGGNPECRNEINDTPLHSLVKAKFKDEREKQSCVLALLAYGDCDPDCKNADGKTALHLAVEVSLACYICIIVSSVACGSSIVEF